MEAVSQRAIAHFRFSTAINVAEVKHVAANVALAASFFAAAIPSGSRYDAGPANLVWVAGAVLMGFFSIIRFPPKTASINIQSIAAATGMLVIPCLMRPVLAAAGFLALAALVLELAGLVVSQTSRIYMGRRFGILPANRGVVTRGPFAAVRHPIYAGWLMLSVGYALAYPGARNFILIAASMPFMVWRIELEEGLLREDPEYRAYRDRVPFRLWPGLL